MDHSNIDQLKRFLFELPSQNYFNFNQDVRKSIRKRLFMAVTNQGKYMNWLFPDVYYNSTYSSREICEKLEREFDWKLSNYYKCDQFIKDSKYYTHNHHAFHSSSPCSRIFRKGEPIYRCLTCGYDDTCALCSNCYNAEFHEGHKVHITICLRENGGVCDCGDPEAWVNEFYCPYASKSDTSANLRNWDLPDEFAHSFLNTIETLLDYVIDVMSHSDLQYLPPDEISEEFLVYYSMNSALDPLKYGYNEAEAVSDVNSDDYSLVVYNDQIRHYRDSVQRIRLASKKVQEFAVMIADKAQSYGKARVLSSKDIQLLRERQEILSATGLATSIRSHRDIFREAMCDEILVWINALTESEMFKSNTEVKNLFCRAFCKRWTNGLLTPSRLSILQKYNTGRLDYYNLIPKVPSDEATNTNIESDHWEFVPKQWSISTEICQECEYNLGIDDYELHNNHLGSRIQYLFYMDIRFWKSIRALLHDMYSTSLITNLKYKLIIACQYVDIYPAVADMFLTMDREAELNIMSTLSTQLFTCPSNSTLIVQHGDLSRIFASIYGFLTVEEIRSPQNLKVCHEVSMKSLKNRRWGQIFFDIGYILGRSRFSTTILSREVIGMACDILALFHGRPVLQRESKAHIEYESPDYTAFFHAISVIYQFGEYVAHCLNSLKDMEKEEIGPIANRAISYIYYFLLKLENNDYPGLSDRMVDINLSSDKTYEIEPIENKPIVLFNIDTDKVSFLHPIHSFLSWMIELSDYPNVDCLKKVLTQASELYNQRKQEKIYVSETFLFEYPIRTIVLMSQIKSGFWVRNGFSVKSQLQLYKGTSLRESGYMRDIYLTQIFANVCSPNLFCYTVFSRWLLLHGWILKEADQKISDDFLDTNEQGVQHQGQGQGPGHDADQHQHLDQEPHSSHQIISNRTMAYEPKNIPYMVEECLNFLIHLLTEDLHLRKLSDQEITKERIQNEIIHNLCFGQMSYTKLCSSIPDHILAEKRFDIVLEELTIFTPPNGTKDAGSYRLKEEFYASINPYYFNYSANTKDDAVKLVKEKLRTSMKIPLEKAVVCPKLRPSEELGIFKYVGNFSTSNYFGDFIIKTLKFVMEHEGNDDSLLETLLHLVHICVYENCLNIDECGSFYTNFIRVSGIFNISMAQVLYELLIKDEFKHHHSKIRAIFTVVNSKYELPLEFEQFNLTDYENQDNMENETERKKRIAKEKQAKLMAKFKRQQSSFMRKNSILKTSEVSDTELEDDMEKTGWCFPETHCILCQNTSTNVGPFGIITYVSKSSMFRSVPFDDKYWFMKAFSDSANLDVDGGSANENVSTENWVNYMNQIKDDNVIGPGFAHHDFVDSKLVSQSCGHGMHFQCYVNFLNSNRNKSNQITRNAPENVDHKEFLCPLCKAIGNMFIPILSANNNRDLSKFLSPGPIDLGDLRVFDTILSDPNILSKPWFLGFANGFCKDLGEFGILTSSAKDLMTYKPELSTDQLQFRNAISHINHLMTFFSFPNVYKSNFTDVITDTIKATEISLRGESSNETLITDQLSNNMLINLRSLNEFRASMIYMTILTPKKDGNFDPFLSTLAGLLIFKSNNSFSTQVMQKDFFQVLNSIFPCPSSGFSFNLILKACFLGHVIQNIMLLVCQIKSHDFYSFKEYSILDVPVISTVDEEKANMATNLFKKVTQYISSNGDEDMIVNDPKFGYVFYSMLIKASTPFLRRAAILSVVTCAENKGVNDELSSVFLEADRLCCFMNIDNVFTLMSKLVGDSLGDEFEVSPEKNFDQAPAGKKKAFEQDKFDSFLTYYKYSVAEEKEIQLEYPGLIRLIDLPERLDFFFTKYYYSDKYNNPHMSIEEPAICLFCGEVVDAQKTSIGCKEGECTTHYLKECSNNIGIFLLPKDKTVLLLHKNGGSFIEAPYLDQHGELPGESKRSKTLYLMGPRYNNLIRKVWLEHNVPNYIVRKLDSVIDAGGWDTL